MTLKTTFAAPMRATRWERLVFIGFGLFGLLVTVYGFATTHILGSELWPQPALWRLGGLAAAVILAGVVVRLFVARQTMAWAAALLSACAIVGFGIGAFAAVMLIFAACLCLGDLVLGKCARELQPAQAASLATATGFALLILGASLAMFFPINTATFYVLVLMAMVLANTSALKIHVFDPLRQVDPLAHPRFGSATYWLGVILVIVILVHAVQAALPERYNDALAFHLLVPSTIEAKGYWPFDVNTYVWAVMPMGGDWAFTIAYLLAGENAIKLLNLSAFLLILWMLYALLAPRVGRVSTLICLLLLATTPVVVLVSASAFIEHQLALFQLAAFIALIHFRARMGLRQTVIAMLLIAAIATTKLNGVIMAGMIGLAVLILVVRQHKPHEWPQFAMVIMAGACLGLLSYANSYILTGNPFFPFFNGFFRSPFYTAENFAHGFPGGLPWNLFYRMTFNSPAYMESANGVFGFQFLAIGLLGAALVLLRRNTVALLALLFGLVYVAAVAFNTQYIRYLYPAFPLLLIVCAEVFSSAGNVGPWYRRTALSCGAAIALLNFALIPAAGWILHGFRLDAVFSDTERRALLQAQAPQRQMISLVNAIAGSSARLAIFGPPVAAGLQGTAVFGNWYTEKFFFGIYYAKSDEDVRRTFSRYQVTHILVTSQASDVAQQKSASFLARFGRLIAAQGSVSLYELDPAAVYTDELLKNGDLSNEAGGWTIEPAIANQPASKLPTDLKPKTWIRQTNAMPVRGGDIYRYKVDMICPAPGQFLSIQINWTARDGTSLGATAGLPNCRATGESDISGLLRAPEEAATAFFYAIPIGTQPLEIHKLSFLQSEFPQ